MKNTVLRAGNGSPIRTQTTRVTLEGLGNWRSYSRPRASNDNTFYESPFRTLKYCPACPSQGFATLDEVWIWLLKFVAWKKTRIVTVPWSLSHRPSVPMAGKRLCWNTAGASTKRPKGTIRNAGQVLRGIEKRTVPLPSTRSGLGKRSKRPLRNGKGDNYIENTAIERWKVFNRYREKEAVECLRSASTAHHPLTKSSNLRVFCIQARCCDMYAEAMKGKG